MVARVKANHVRRSGSHFLRGRSDAPAPVSPSLAAVSAGVTPATTALVDAPDDGHLEASWAASSPGGGRGRRRWSWPKRLAFGGGSILLLGGVALAVTYFAGRPHLSVTASASSLVDVHAGGWGTTVRSIEATSGGQPVPLVHAGSGLVPAAPIAQGQTIEVTAVVSAPSWLHWLFGPETTVSKTITTPSVAAVTRTTLTDQPGKVAVTFDRPASLVEYRIAGGSVHTIRLAQPAATVDIPVPAGAAAGELSVTAAPFAWEKLAPTAQTVQWFNPPPSGAPVALTSPAPGSTTADAAAPIEFTFDQPVSKALGSTKPTITPAVAGTWSEPGPNTLVFTPTGFGFGPDTAVQVSFDRAVEAVGTAPGAASTAASTGVAFQTAPGSYLRMEQILADLHYLPLNFTPAAGVTRPSTLSAEVTAMASPPAGSFSWRWASTPASLKANWAVGADNEVLKGALMSFLSDQGTYDGYQATDETVPQLATASVWHALLQADLAGKSDPHPYSYVYVSQTLPQSMSLWENGSVVLTTAVNTGIASRPTADGTFPIYVRYTLNYMDGTNPNGSKYHDLVYWINYFNGGDAVHGFVRGSYGYPQSLGCVELPLPAAQTAYNNLAIGDLVTVVG